MSPTNKSDSKSETRTKWSEDRTVMSNERTFSSWLGSGMAALGVALGLKAVFGAFEPTWAAKLVATAFVLVAILLFQSARRNACKTLNRISDNDAETMPTKNFTLIAHGLTIGALAIGVILWML